MEQDSKVKSMVNHNGNANAMITLDECCSLTTDEEGQFGFD